MRWEPPRKWTEKFAWLPVGINCGNPSTGLGKTVWLEFVYVRYTNPHFQLVMTKEEHDTV